MMKELNDLISILEMQATPGGDKNNFFFENKLTTYSDNRN